MEYGNQVELYEGVRTWFERIRDYGLEHGVRIGALHHFFWLKRDD